MKKMCFFMSLVVVGLCLSACNTVKGFGQDLQQGGQALQKSASQDTDNNPR